jgi:hypothetical protein
MQVQWLDKNNAHDLWHAGLAILVKLAAANADYLPPGLLITGVTLSNQYAGTRGSFARIRRGTYQRQDVATKELLIKSPTAEEIGKVRKVSQIMMSYHTVADGQHRLNEQQLMREVVVWKHLNNANVLKFLGVAILDVGGSTKITTLVTPFMHNGTLTDWIRKFEPRYRTLTQERHRLVSNICRTSATVNKKLTRVEVNRLYLRTRVPASAQYCARGCTSGKNQAFLYVLST